MALHLAPPTVWIGLLSFRRWVDIGAAWLLVHIHIDQRISPLGNSTVYMSSTDVGRNRIMKEALASDAEYLWFLDDDTHVDGVQDSAMRLVDMVLFAQRTGATIVAPPAPIQGGEHGAPPQPNVLAADCSRRMAWHEVLGVKEAGGVGTACMVVDLNWVRANRPVAPWFLTRHNEDGLERGSDYGFCRDSIELGAKVFVYGKQWVHNWNQALPNRDKLAKRRLKGK